MDDKFHVENELLFRASCVLRKFNILSAISNFYRHEYKINQITLLTLFEKSSFNYYKNRWIYFKIFLMSNSRHHPWKRIRIPDIPDYNTVMTTMMTPSRPKNNNPSRPPPSTWMEPISSKDLQRQERRPSRHAKTNGHWRQQTRNADAEGHTTMPWC